MKCILTTFTSLLAMIATCQDTRIMPIDIDPEMVMEHMYTNEENGMPESHVFYYGKGNVPIRFDFPLEGAGIEAGNAFKKTAGEVFLNRSLLQEKALYASRRFEVDSVGFTTNTINMQLSRIGKIDHGDRHYLLFKFNRHEMDTTPYERNYFYVFDVSNKEAVTAIGFIAIAPEGENSWPYMWFGGNGLHIKNEYWDPYGKTTRTLWLEQDKNNLWPGREADIKDGE